MSPRLFFLHHQWVTYPLKYLNIYRMSYSNQAVTLTDFGHHTFFLSCYLWFTLVRFWSNFR